ncbi:acetyltransferase, GNAT family family [Aspergillus terreus]|uniref:Acetyltransferase, GNAT family family n=1 Tax=Aspergillus terreus TaxID=33178 RepID=A0A5M3ZA28_ASPTE|nr:hypothetical protein ATETN484_0012042800 [Aspergillus terreus]GFF19666.1 acetyltransferase, GNAT family family [Aspergillus terreus]
MSTTMTTMDPPAQKEDPTTLPDLETYTTKSPDDLIDALRLIADSVAQQRQAAARHIIFHPLCVSAMVAVMAIAYRLLYRELSDLPLVGTTCAGCVMAGLLVVRACTEGYIEEAERVGKWEWLFPGSGSGTGVDGGLDSGVQEQVVLVTKFGERIIGTVVLRAAVAAGSAAKSKGVIRAWTVERRYRGNGVGVGLLEEAVAVCKRKGWEGPEFDEQHANAKRVLPALFRGGEERELWARKLLERLLRY